MEKNESHVSFKIIGFDDISHEDISDMLDLQPDLIYIKGQPISTSNKMIAKENVWAITFPNEKKIGVEAFENQLEKLYKILIKRVDFLKMLCKKYDSEFSFTFYIYADSSESTPIIHLERHHHQLISNLNSETDYDVILVSDTPPPVIMFKHLLHKFYRKLIKS